MAESIDPWAPKVAFSIKIHDFWAPFWHRFFDFFRKWQKCEISEEYNAKRGSEPSKTMYFCIDFSSNFHVFSNPLPEIIFRGTLRRSRPKHLIFNGFWHPARSQNNPFEHHFRSKGRQKGYPAKSGSLTRADLGAIWRRKRAKDVCSSILVPFLTDSTRN